MSDEKDPLGSPIISAPLFRNIDDGPLQCIPGRKLERLLAIDEAARELLIAEKNFRAAYDKLAHACKPT